jgi:hypothetical protein
MSLQGRELPTNTAVNGRSLAGCRRSRGAARMFADVLAPRPAAANATSVVGAARTTVLIRLNANSDQSAGARAA